MNYHKCFDVVMMCCGMRLSVWMNMFVIVIEDETKEIKNQRHSCISHQMKDGSGDLIVNMLLRVVCMVVDSLV